MTIIEPPLQLMSSGETTGRFAGKLMLAGAPATEDNKTGRSDISSLVTNLNVSYTMDMASQLSFDIIDPFNISSNTLKFAGSNYFIPGRDVIYETQTIGAIDADGSSVTNVRQLFEIASVTFQQGPGVSPTYSVSCYTKAIQQMKRDREPSAIKGSGTSFVYNAARKYGLRFYGQQTSKKQTITKAKGSKQAESLWNVIDRLAGEAKFVCYEVNGVLIFASEKYLLNKWGPQSSIKVVKSKDESTPNAKQKFKQFFPVTFPSRPSDLLQLTQFPTITKSANDAYEGNGSLVVDRKNGVQLRPGMTIRIDGLPNFGGSYLVTDVSFADMSADPVSITFRTPTKDEEKDPVKDLKIGKKLTQTYTTSNSRFRVKNVNLSAKDNSGKPVQRPWMNDARLRPLPTESNPYSYPRMGRANLTKLYNKNSIFGPDDQSSTLEENTLLVEGNIDLWDRPVLVGEDGKVQTLFSITHEITASAPFKCVLLPTIFTENGQPVQKTEEEVKARYEADGGYLGSAKHLGVIGGSTKRKAILNARDYGTLLSWQNDHVVKKRFTDDPVNTPGGPDSEW